MKFSLIAFAAALVSSVPVNDIEPQAEVESEEANLCDPKDEQCTRQFGRFEGPRFGRGREIGVCNPQIDPLCLPIRGRGRL
ncbi:hypothetical protein DSO57_1035338 [Entomophthora muscae]|uniref:Uncharacterized protein n=1 Tax=Entomophthora muscae TaxID=34485 RepID=A0ACC2UJY7_9FUNG|nr:hypothetical protein DSO57_1035338 [Entomophthora muscae]